MIQRRLHATAQTDLSLYVAYTHAPLPSLISQPSVNVHTCFFATGITGLFSGLAVSKVKQKTKKNENTENTTGAFHLKNEKPFANGCKSAKNQLRSVKMLFGSELICDTLA